MRAWCWTFFGLLLSKLTGNAISTRFLTFSIVGSLGLAVHLIVLRLALLAGFAFPSAQSVAVIVAMMSNFFPE